MKTLFFGTPALAVPFLTLLSELTEVKAVVTTPDEPAGRGYERKPTPVKEAALRLNLPVLQPAVINDDAFRISLESLNPDVVIVVAYGKILPPAVLKVPRLGYINVHFSLLPAYRGAAPIQRALMNGETQTGVTLFWLDEGMDTGPIFVQKNVDVGVQENAETLRGKLVQLGLDALRDVLSQLKEGRVIRNPQVGSASLAPSLKKQEGQIDWSKPARSIANLIRGTNPWPGAFTFVHAGDKPQRLKILEAMRVVRGDSPGETSSEGSVVSLESGRGFVVRCGQDSLQILHVQPEGKKPMSAWDYWQGKRMKLGEKLG